MENLFSYIKLSVCPARGQAFIGRQRQLARIMDMIAAPKPHHISVYGLPHIGKTSFLIKLHEVASEKDDYLCVRVPAFVEGDFCNNMVNIIDAMAEEELDLDPIADGISDDADAQELIGALRQALQQVTRSGRRTVLLLDEFERILGPTEDQLAAHNTALRGWTQTEYELFLELLMDRELDFVCVTASRPQMTNILYRYRPAHDPFIPMLLVGFDDTEMKAYFDVLKQGNVCLDNIPLGQEPDQIQQQELLRLCGRSPYLLTVMGNELFENGQKTGKEARKTVKGLFSRCRDTFQTYFNDIVYFMVAEEQKKMRSFSHIIKCYFGQFEDYQDIKERCIAKGYLDLAAKDSPYTYRGKVFEFVDRDDKFEVLDENGHGLSGEEKEKAGLAYITVSPLFTDYLFGVRQPIGKKKIIPLDMVDDPRDLLTGLIHTMRDITRKEMRMICQNEDMSVSRWDELLVKQYKASKYGCQQIIHVNTGTQHNAQRYALWESAGGNVTPIQSQSIHDGEPTAQNWSQFWSDRTIYVSSSSLKFVSDAIRQTNNEMASLDPINLIDHMRVFQHYWQYQNRPLFSNYFSILPNGQAQLEAMLEHLKSYRNKVSHFSRYGYGPNEIEHSRIYCRQLLKGIYYYLYSGEPCPVGSLTDTPGV